MTDFGGRYSSMTDRRLANLQAALGFLQLDPREPELVMLHHWLDCWRGVGGRRRRDAPSGVGPSIDRVRQRTLAGDVLRDRDGAFNHGRLSLRTDTVAGEATGGMGGGEAAALKGLSLGWRARAPPCSGLRTHA